MVERIELSGGRHKYTTVNNIPLKDQNISPKAKGLLTLLLVLNRIPNWNFSLRGIVEMCDSGSTAVSTAIKELEKSGYLIKVKENDENGEYFRTTYHVFEMPQKIQPKIFKGDNVKSASKTYDSNDVFQIHSSADTYSIIPNEYIFGGVDKNNKLKLRLSEIGLMSFLYCLHEDSQITISRLVKLYGFGDWQLRSSLDTLREKGYIEIYRKRDDKGRYLETIYKLYERRITKSNNDTTFNNSIPDITIDENPIMEKSIPLLQHIGNPIMEESIPLSNITAESNETVIETQEIGKPSSIYPYVGFPYVGNQTQVITNIISLYNIKIGRKLRRVVHHSKPEPKYNETKEILKYTFKLKSNEFATQIEKERLEDYFNLANRTNSVFQNEDLNHKRIDKWIINDIIYSMTSLDYQLKSDEEKNKLKSLTFNHICYLIDLLSFHDAFKLKSAEPKKYQLKLKKSIIDLNSNYSNHLKHLEKQKLSGKVGENTEFLNKLRKQVVFTY